MSSAPPDQPSDGSSPERSGHHFADDTVGEAVIDVSAAVVLGPHVDEDVIEGHTPDAPLEGTPAVRKGLLVAAALLYVTGTIGSNVGPAWVDERPALVLLMSSRNRNLLGSVPFIDVIPYAVIGFIRVFVVGVVLYYVGRYWGVRALAWTEKQLGELPAIYRWFQIAIDRAGWLLILLMPGSNLVCMMAGYRRMQLRMFVPLLAVGVALKLIVLRIGGDLFDSEIRSALKWIDKYQWWVVGGLFAISFLQSARKAKQSTGGIPRPR